MDKYGVQGLEDLQRQELRSVRDQIASYAGLAVEGELSKTASAELQVLLERAADLEEAIASRDAT